MSNRHLARTIALQTIFAWDFNGQKEAGLEELIADNFANFAPQFDDHGFVRDLVAGVASSVKQIDKYIVKYATEWPLDQITTVDRNILRLGMYELLYTEVPPRVAINESIEIAKSFGGDSSGKFVNGVLGALYADEVSIQKRDNKEEMKQEEKEKEEEKGEQEKKENDKKTEKDKKEKSVK